MKRCVDAVNCFWEGNCRNWAEVRIEPLTSVVMAPRVTAVLGTSTHEASQKGFSGGQGEKGRQLKLPTLGEVGPLVSWLGYYPPAYDELYTLF